MSEQNYRALDDPQLIRRTQDGDSEAFGELYTRYLDPIYRYVRARVAAVTDAEDLTETVFLRTFKAIGRYEDRQWPFSAYLYRVARNLLIDHYRKQDPWESIETAEVDPGGIRAADDRVLRDENMLALEQTLEQLPSDYQEVIRLRVLLSMPTPEVAQWLGRSEGAVRVLLCRALKSLREKMGDDNG
ncbi:MAG TPA: sigma-70 family RNA polymerase sigma factor [Anaerolineales bacterium]|nr:sigma-70 family RNA polymerase sigma factor [Anaerolineales bacterium]